MKPQAPPRWFAPALLRRGFGRLVLASLLAFTAHAFPQASAPRKAPARSVTARRERARTGYERALGLRASLESKPEDKRQKPDYLTAIHAFREVYRLNPAYSKTPPALAAVAELYEQMGRVFSSDRYFYESVNAYQFLISQYPKSPAARQAAYSIAQVYQTDLENPHEARKAFQGFLGQYPQTSKAKEAREQLKELDRREVGQVAGRAPDGATTGRPAPRQPKTEKPRTSPPAQLMAIRHWVGLNYSRIVISLDGEAKFDTSRLDSPDRIVLDLSNTQLSPALTGRAFPGEDGYLRQIRVAQYKPGVARVVLDVQKIEDYSIFTLPNPFRLVIDIHGTSSTASEKPPGAQRVGGTTTEAASRAPVATADLHPPPSTDPTRLPAAAGQSAKADKPEASSETATKRTEAKAREREATTEEERAARATPAAPMASGGRTLTRALGLKIGRVVIDAGHGGHDTGTIGPTGICEKDVVLDVALRLRSLLERDTGSSIVLTRSDDTFIPLEERTAIANQNSADLFISIHANASRDKSARGLEAYYLNFTSNPEALEVAARENATSQESVHQLQDLIKRIALTEKVEESHEFAKLVERQIHQSLAKAGNAQRDRGVKRAPFVVLIGANMPSILAEISFLTNPRDERLLNRPDYRQKIAEGIYQGIVHYMNTLARVSMAGPVRPPRP